ncbi:MAG: type III-B CRISPR module RAMP protein Cmr1 [bacterium]
MTQNRSMTIEATYRIVTPMFCSGADQSTAELRIPSFKGALRFWWRAAEWARLCAANHGDVPRAVAALRTEEASLFGSRDAGQSRIVLSTQWAPLDDSKLVRNWPNSSSVGSTYMGFGITESGRPGTRNHKPHRIGVPCAREFQLACRVRPAAKRVDTASVARAMRLLGLLGGLGSRSRRGFGSLAITSIDGQACLCESFEEYRKQIGDALTSEARNDTFPPFTAFSSQARIANVCKAGDVFQAHDRLGERYREFRGQLGPYRGATKKPLGLPLKDVDEQRRRASPLLMHVHPIGQEFVGSVLFLPGKFHPEIAEGDSLPFFKIASDWMKELKGFAL